MSERPLPSLPVPPELVEELVTRVLDRLQEAPERRYLSKEATAEFLGVKPRTLKTFIEKGCPAHRVGRVQMFDTAEVGQWIQRHAG